MFDILPQKPAVGDWIYSWEPTWVTRAALFVIALICLLFGLYMYHCASQDDNADTARKIRYIGILSYVVSGGVALFVLFSLFAPALQRAAIKRHYTSYKISKEDNITFDSGTKYADFDIVFPMDYVDDDHILYYDGKYGISMIYILPDYGRPFTIKLDFENAYTFGEEYYTPYSEIRVQDTIENGFSGKISGHAYYAFSRKKGTDVRINAMVLFTWQDRQDYEERQLSDYARREIEELFRNLHVTYPNDPQNEIFDGESHIYFGNVWE